MTDTARLGRRDSLAAAADTKFFNYEELLIGNRRGMRDSCKNDESPPGNYTRFGPALAARPVFSIIERCRIRQSGDTGSTLRSVPVQVGQASEPLAEFGSRLPPCEKRD
jgi:hypothetical protein